MYAEYEKGGQLDCHATLQYTGQVERVTVYTGEPAVIFTLDNNDGYTIGGMRLDVLAAREFTKGETKDFLFENGGFDEDSPTGVEAYLTPDELTLPKGTYTLSALFRYSLDPKPGIDNSKTLEVSTTIKVA